MQVRQEQAKQSAAVNAAAVKLAGLRLPSGAVCCWRTVAMVCCLLLLGACSSTTFVYNRLDFLVPWYVDDYVQLNAQQEAYLDTLLVPFLAWHRNHELPVYLQLIDTLERQLDAPFTPADAANTFAALESAWLRLEKRALDGLLELGAQLSDAQVAELMAALWEQQEEYQDDYLERTDAEFYQDNLDNFVDNTKEYLGSISSAQRTQLRQFSTQLQRADQVWLAERAAWLEQLAVLLQRNPGWQQRLRAAIIARRENPPPAYARIYAHNLQVSYDAITVLLNGRSARQDRYLRAELENLRQDLITLVAQGQPQDEAATG